MGFGINFTLRNSTQSREESLTTGKMLQPDFWPLPLQWFWSDLFWLNILNIAHLSVHPHALLRHLHFFSWMLMFLFSIFCQLAAFYMHGSVPKALLCTSDASEDLTPPSPVYHLHLRMGNGCYHSVSSSTLWLCCQGSSHRHVPKEWIRSWGFSLLHYKIPISIVLWCFVTVFQEKL